MKENKVNMSLDSATEEQTTNGKIKIDFTNMDELRRSIIVSEILNRKY